MDYNYYVLMALIGSCVLSSLVSTAMGVVMLRNTRIYNRTILRLTAIHARAMTKGNEYIVSTLLGKKYNGDDDENLP